MKNIFIKNKKAKILSGFTIIETMISVSLFLVIMTIGMGAFLNANVLHQKSQDTRSVMDNLSFIMEDISRNLRTGYDYDCVPGEGQKDCSTPKGSISFTSQYGGSWRYKIEGLVGENIKISRSTDGGANWVQLNSDGIIFDSGTSFFIVKGADSVGDKKQPMVTIHLGGKIMSKGGETLFNLQTSVSQRKIDF